MTLQRSNLSLSDSLAQSAFEEDPADPQAWRVYAAEATLFFGYERGWLSSHQCQELIFKIFRNHTLNSKYPGVFDRPCKLYHLTELPGDSLAYACGSDIFLSEKGQGANVITHEVAHVITDRVFGDTVDHGREFCTVHLDIVRAIFGPTLYDLLRANYSRAHVKYDVSDISDCDCWLCSNRKFELKPNGSNLQQA